MSRDSSTFCDQINDAGRVVADAGMDDLRELVDRNRRSGQLGFSLARTRDMDSGIEVVSTPEGTAIFGCEDSLRGSFAFYYCDPSKVAKRVTVGIHEVPKHALCDSLESAIQIAELFFREGELDRRFSWMLDINVGDRVKRGNLLAAGDNLQIEAFIARVKQGQTA